MRAHLVQLDIAWEDRDANVRRVRDLVRRADPHAGDLVVLPEMFDSGFSMRVDRTADDGRTLEAMRTLATDLGVWVVGGRTVPPVGGGKARNRASVLDPDGDLTCEYDKVHPFGFGKEPEVIEGGNRSAVFEWAAGDDPLRVGLAICYDLRFPELFRALTLRHEAEALVVIANWPRARHAHWRTLAIARAIENQAYLLAVNRAGNDPHLSYAGGSIAVGPKGDLLGEFGEDEGVLSVALDPEAVRSWRAEFPALRDVRTESPEPTRGLASE